MGAPWARRRSDNAGGIPGASPSVLPGRRRRDKKKAQVLLASTRASGGSNRIDPAPISARILYSIGALVQTLVDRGSLSKSSRLAASLASSAARSSGSVGLVIASAATAAVPVPASLDAPASALPGAGTGRAKPEEPAMPVASEITTADGDLLRVSGDPESSFPPGPGSMSSRLTRRSPPPRSTSELLQKT
jgi:hypothetical protein